MASPKWTVSGWRECLLAVVVMIPAVASGQEFRVDTELFQNQDKKPFLQTLTIFADGTVYDFQLTEPAETTVFDARRGHFTLLDESRKVKASLTTQELLDFSLALESRAAQQKGLIAFCATPQFETTDASLQRNGQSLIELRLIAKPMAYLAEGQKTERDDAVKSYRHFADWCARLNATRAGNLPPGARLALNQALAEHELLPLEITRTIPASGPLDKKQELRSEHRWNWSLSGEDRKKIERASNMMATFQVVSFDDYRGPTAKAATSKQTRR
jgi:hypothetical protein